MAGEFAARPPAVLDDELATADARFETLVEDPVVKRLTTVPSIGPITATAYVAALDDAARFAGAAQVTYGCPTMGCWTEDGFPLRIGNDSVRRSA